MKREEVLVRVAEGIEVLVADAVIRERVRIWNEIHDAASMKPGPDNGPMIIFIGEPKLREIILPTLPENMGAIPNEPNQIAHNQ